MKNCNVSLRMSEDLYGRIEAVIQGGNRNGWILEAIERRLKPEPEVALTDKDKTKIIKNAIGLEQLMDDALRQALENKKDFLGTLSEAELARLAISRMPKVVGGDGEVKEEILSLTECLAMLPTTEDISKELNRVKGELFKTERERDMNAALLKVHKKTGSREDFAFAVFRGAVECAFDMVARRSFPGYGDGGGVSKRGYEEIGKRVKSELEKLNVELI